MKAIVNVEETLNRFGSHPDTASVRQRIIINCPDCNQPREIDKRDLRRVSLCRKCSKARRDKATIRAHSRKMSHIDEALIKQYFGYTSGEVTMHARVVVRCPSCKTTRVLKKQNAYKHSLCRSCSHTTDVPLQDNQATLKHYGYSIEDAKRDSPIVTTCSHCHKKKIVQKRYYDPNGDNLCRSCSGKKNAGFLWGKRNPETELKVPCGIIVPAAEGRRCNQYLTCEHYKDCLDRVVFCDPEAYKWKGWKHAEAA
jgi:hypothetical protein